MKQFSWRLTQLFVIPLLLALVFVSVSSLPAAALVFSQATRQFNPGQTFCLPTQKVDGVHKVPGTHNGQVASGGFSFDNNSGSPIATLWTVYNGPTKGKLSVIAQVTTSFYHQVFTVPIGSLYRTCIKNTTTVFVAFSIQQTESLFCCVISTTRSAGKLR